MIFTHLIIILVFIYSLSKYYYIYLILDFISNYIFIKFLNYIIKIFIKNKKLFFNNLLNIILFLINKFFAFKPQPIWSQREVF